MGFHTVLNVHTVHMLRNVSAARLHTLYKDSPSMLHILNKQCVPNLNNSYALQCNVLHVSVNT